MLYMTESQWNSLQATPMPRCPRWLSPEAREVWKATAPMLRRKGHLFAIDAGMFAVYCANVAAHRRAVENLRTCPRRYRKLYARVERLTRRIANTSARMFLLPPMPRLDEKAQTTKGKPKR